jgi:hypothetical protein
MDDRALMQMALDTLRDARIIIQLRSEFLHDSLKKQDELEKDLATLSPAINALSERLNQPEPEFVDWQGVAADQAMTIAMMTLESKREWVGLESDEQILEISKEVWGKDKLNRGRDDHRPFYIDFARAIEAILKERNT